MKYAQHHGSVPLYYLGKAVQGKKKKKAFFMQKQKLHLFLVFQQNLKSICWKDTNANVDLSINTLKVTNEMAEESFDEL